MSQNKQQLFQQIPAVDDLVKVYDDNHPTLPRQLILKLIHQCLDEIRQLISSGKEFEDVSTYTRQTVSSTINNAAESSLQKVINGTGIVLHTGLGRAPVGQEVWKNILPVVTAYSNIELNLSDGKRGERSNHIAPVLNAITGAEATLAVNNNAAAVLLMLNSVAENREVIISRGQQVEIGGSFRIPDVIRKSGCHMVEVGTTNKTHLKDYQQAITENTGAILVAHPSNYRVSGFTQSVPVKELAKLCHQNNIPLLVDLGSGAVIDLPDFGLPHEPLVHTFFEDGADVVSFSGDKLLGGPQAGIICGSKSLIKMIHENPMYRALRLDKVMLAILDEVTRTIYSPQDFSAANLAMTLLKRNRDELELIGQHVLNQIGSEIKSHYTIRLENSVVQAGSGSLPTEAISSKVIIISSTEVSMDSLAARFRTASTPLIGYIQDNNFHIDLKAIPDDDITELIHILKEILV